MFKSLLLSLLLLTNFGFVFLSNNRAWGQNPPAKTYQPGFWQPIARADATKPIKIKLQNLTNITIDYDITESETSPVSIVPSRVVTLENVKPSSSMYIAIYPNNSKISNSQIYLQYQVEVTEDNIVVINISTTEDGAMSHRSFNLQETGGIYLY